MRNVRTQLQSARVLCVRAAPGTALPQCTEHSAASRGSDALECNQTGNLCVTFAEGTADVPWPKQHTGKRRTPAHRGESRRAVMPETLRTAALLNAA